MREVKLAATLGHLVDEDESRWNRKQVCADLGISPSLLSQYISGQTKPSLEKLIAFSDLFKVSVDYLLFGKDAVAGEGGVLDYGPFARYVEAGFSLARDELAVQSAFVAKVGSILSDQIAEATRTAAKRPVTMHGMLDREQTLELERFSVDSVIVSMDLDDDIVQVDGNIEQGVAANNFISVIADNIRQGRKYHFVLAPDMLGHEEVADRYRALLRRQKLNAKDLKRCTFTVATEAFYVDFGIYRLDVASLERQSPVLYQYVKPFLGPDGTLGYTEPPASPSRAFILMDDKHRRLAVQAAERLIAGGT